MLLWVQLNYLERHTKNYLKNVILNELKKLNIDVQKIHTMTIDNGANFFKAVKLENQQQEEEK